MQKNWSKYVLGAALFVDFCSVAVVGLLLAVVIPTGRGARADNYFLGLHRHQWGAIHQYLASLLLVLLASHVWLNRKWIVQSTKRYFGIRWKRVLGCFSAAWILVLVVAWLVAKL